MANSREGLQQAAERCRQLADTCTTDFARDALNQTAHDLDLKAETTNVASQGSAPSFANEQETRITVSELSS
jgi:hypothetical protein